LSLLSAATVCVCVRERERELSGARRLCRQRLCASSIMSAASVWELAQGWQQVLAPTNCELPEKRLVGCTSYFWGLEACGCSGFVRPTKANAKSTKAPLSSSPPVLELTASCRCSARCARCRPALLQLKLSSPCRCVVGLLNVLKSTSIGQGDEETVCGTWAGGSGGSGGAGNSSSVTSMDTQGQGSVDGLPPVMAAAAEKIACDPKEDDAGVGGGNA
jgi:hypothetical protein